MKHAFQVPGAKHAFPNERLTGSSWLKAYQLCRRMRIGEQHAPSSSCHFSHPRASLVLGAQDCKYYKYESHYGALAAS